MPWPRYSLTNLMEMLVKVELRLSAARPLPRRQGPRTRRPRATKHILLAWTGADLCCAVHANRGTSSRSSTDSPAQPCCRAVQAASAGGSLRPGLANSEEQNEYMQILVPFLSKF